MATIYFSTAQIANGKELELIDSYQFIDEEEKVGIFYMQISALGLYNYRKPKGQFENNKYMPVIEDTVPCEHRFICPFR